MRGKKLLSVLALVVFVTVMFTGCKNQVAKDGELPSKINEIALTVDKVTDMPDWEGNKLDLVYWFCQGTNAPTIGQADTDSKIRDELTRISGISWNEELSFDNNGESVDAKISKIIAADTWPDFAYNLEESLVKRLVQADKIWDLTELIPECMPNYMKIVNYNERSKKQFESKRIDGHDYVLNKPASYGTAVALDKDYSPEKYSKVVTPEETRTWIWVRDDILTKLYPQAKTKKQIEEAYAKNGSFTKEEMTDFSIKSKDEFKDFLEKINSLNIEENGRRVYPFYTHNGTDNWDILTVLNSALNGGIASASTDYFAYFDKEQGKIVRTIDQPWFKESMKFYVDLVREDVASREAIVDNKAAFEQKKNNGEYAVLYGSALPPEEDVLKAGNKNFSYRKVLIDIAPDYNRFIKQNTSENYVAGERFAIFKTKTVKSEQDVRQILRYIDFMLTPIGSKCVFWGREDSGLYTQDGDKLTYTDKELEKDLVYGGMGKKRIYYGINSFPSLENIVSFGSRYYPKTVYNISDKRIGVQYATAWRYSAVEPAPEYPDLKVSENIWNWSTKVKGVGKFWDARKSSEDAFTVVFTTNNDSEFEQYFNELKDTITRNGLDEATMKEWNEQFKAENSEYYDEFIKWNP